VYSGIHRATGEHIIAKVYRNETEYEHELKVLKLIRDKQLKHFPKLVTNGKL